MNYRDEWNQRREAEEAKQLTCDHVWHSEFTYGRDRCSSTWCQKCNITAFAYERDKQPAI